VIEMPAFVEQCWQSVDTGNAEIGRVAEFSVEANPVVPGSNSRTSRE